MSIRSNASPARDNLSAELQDILRRNGMQAHIHRQGEGYVLSVQGHDSPLLSYSINARQMRALTDWGTNAANKKAYNTFVDLVKDDFHLPRNFVHARNANGRVAMGLHGYRIGVGEYGRSLGWTPRNQEGFHMRRAGGGMFMQGAPIVPERSDGRMKPGELQNGGYGFYYKGGQEQRTSQASQDVLSDLQSVITPLEPRPRVQEPARPYNELVTSDVYFSNDKWQECLSSHGIIIDAEKKTMTIQSMASQQDFIYDLTPDEAGRLTDNSIADVPLQSRIDLINNVIRNDFEGALDMDMLNSKGRIALELTQSVKAELNSRQQMEVGQPVPPLAQDGTAQVIGPEYGSAAHVDGNTLQELNENKGWFREGKHGREVRVDDIRVEPVRSPQGEIERDKKGGAKFRMTAVINGQSVSHEITQKQYDKFMAIDDYHRMKLFSRIFNEVDMKTVPGQGNNLGARIGGALLAGLGILNDMGRDRHAPSVFVEQHPGPRPHVYFKEGVDSPQELAARAFDAGLNAGERSAGIGHGR